MRLLMLIAVGSAVAACGSDVRSDADGSGGKGGADQACYAACLAKGSAADVCADYCGGSKGAGGKGAGGKGAGGNGTGGTGAAGAGGSLDVDLEKACIACLYEDAEAAGCSAEAKTCEQSLACTQLQYCPSLCGKPDCLPECNDIIPSGVAPLTDLVQCMACADAPCASACADTLILSYCN